MVALSPDQITTLITDWWTPPGPAALPAAIGTPTAAPPGPPSLHDPPQDPWQQVSSTAVDPAAAAACPSHGYGPAAVTAVGRRVIDFSLLDDQVRSRPPSPTPVPAANRAAIWAAMLSRDQLDVEGDFT